MDCPVGWLKLDRTAHTVIAEPAQRDDRDPFAFVNLGLGTAVMEKVTVIAPDFVACFLTLSDLCIPSRLAKDAASFPSAQVLSN